MRNWATVGLLLFFPLTAILHHAVFYRPTCILNPLAARDWDFSTIALWLTKDPSPYIGLAAAVAILMLGYIFQSIRPYAIAFLLATIPLAIWIWDIPFTERVICHHWHDNHTWLKTRHFYMFAAVAFLPILYWLAPRSKLFSFLLQRVL